MANFLQKAEKPVLYTALGILLFLGIKNYINDEKSDGTKETIQKISENIDTIKAGVDTVKVERRLDADTLKQNVKDIDTVVNRTEQKVDTLIIQVQKVQQTADSILDKVEECCDCKKKPVVKPKQKSKPQPKQKVQPKPQPQSKPELKPVVNPVVRDTVVQETVQPKQVVNPVKIVCYERVIWSR